jgi:hypothetical protein
MVNPYICEKRYFFHVCVFQIKAGPEGEEGGRLFTHGALNQPHIIIAETLKPPYNHIFVENLYFFVPTSTYANNFC